MKQMIRGGAGAAVLGRAQRAAAEKPALRTAARCAGGALFAFALSGAALLGAPLPLAVGFVAAAPGLAAQVSALAGAVAGYAAFWGVYAGIEGMAAAFLVFACVRIFSTAPQSARLWFAPGTAAAMTAVISALFALTMPAGLRAAALLGAKILLAAVSAVGFRRAIEDGDRWAGLFALAGLVLGLCGVPLPGGMTLGMAAGAAAAVCAAGSSAGAAAAGAFGLAVELGGGHGAAAGFLLGGILCLAFGTKRGVWRAAVFTAAVTAAVLVAGDALSLIPAAAIGAAASVPLPALLFPGRPREAEGERSVRAQLSLAADALSAAGERLSQEPDAPEKADAAVIFDRTADEICRCCGSFARCWEQDAAETYRALSEAAPQILARGQARREDFPRQFRCTRIDAFARAVSASVDELRLRRACRAGCERARAAAAEQFALLAAFLRGAGELHGRSALRPDRFRCEAVCRSAGRRGGVSGDRAVSLRAPGNRLYVLLCDGMGTGEAAAGEAAAAVDVLAGLLAAGAPPETAIGLYDASCRLRTGGGFATVDLFAADLITGECTLYKKGAAPSQLKKGRRVGAVGAVTLPPGYSAGEEGRPGRYRVPLAEEDVLVLLSDGVPGERAAERLAGWSGEDAAALAGSLIEGCTEDDDATAVVIRLRPRTIG